MNEREYERMMETHKFWSHEPKKVQFKEEVEVKIKYSCEYEVIKWDDLSPKEREASIDDVDYVRILCSFQDYMPVARGFELETFNDAKNPLMPLDFVHIPLSYTLFKEYGSEIEQWMLEDYIDEYEYVNWLGDERPDDIPFFNKLLTHMLFERDSSSKQIDEKVRKWVHDLVSYIIAPQVKIEDADNYNPYYRLDRPYKKTRPENYLKILENDRYRPEDRSF